MAGVIKRIHDLDVITTLNSNDVFVVDVELAPSALLLETGDNLLLETGDNLLLEGAAATGYKTYQITYADLIAIGAKAVVDVGSNTTLAEANFYNIKGGTIFAIVSSTSVFSSIIAFSMEIKNSSGATITINRSSSDTFYELGGTTTTFDLSDGEACKLTAVSASQWAIT